MAKRLTQRDEFGNADIIGVESTLLYGDLDTPEELNAVTAALNKLAAYEDAEERGLIVRLPCPIGERVYAVNGGYYCEFPDAETTCEAGAKYRACEYYSSGGCKAPLYDHNLELGVRTKPFEYTDIPNVGKTVFLTSTEAEAALQAQDAAQ